MGVYIPFANRLPSSCDFCYISLSGCKARNPYVDGRPNNCPLVEVKPHGRLIDTDELEVNDGWLDNQDGTQTHIQFVYANSIIYAPTVIEAEEGET